MKSLYISALALLIAAQGLMAQPYINQAIPPDSRTVIGKLDNGMTYYIRPCSSKEGKADFYIVHNVGALQEEDNQNGLAHFLEHMAFNGTRHYPDKEIFPFLASEGVRFGYNINAYTSRYETVYYLTSVPLVRESFTDSVLTIIRDWSCDISCEQDALDAERGVISEEWRRRDDTRTRMALKQNALLYKGSKHTRRSVLGTLEVINGFKREEILDFYHKWYRPDLQAVIITGDFDPAQMEAMVREKFGDIPASINPAPKGDFSPVPIESPLFENMTDPEIQYYVLKVFHRQAFPNAEQRRSAYWIKELLCRNMVNSIVDDRMKSQTLRSSCPVRNAIIVTNANNVEFYSTQFTITPKSENRLEDALTFYETTMKRLLQYGVSEEEIESARYKVETKFKLDEEVYDNKLSTKEIADACKENFLRGYPCIYTGEKNRLMKSVLSSISAEDIKATITLMFEESEKIYSFSIRDSKKELIPSEERMLAIIDSVSHSEIAPEFARYKRIDLSLDAPACSIVKTRKDSKGEVWTLDNGAVVYWTPSDKLESNIHTSLRLVYPSGYDALDEKGSAKERFAIKYLDRFGGLRGIDRLTLKSMTQGAGVRMSVSQGQYSSEISVLADGDNADKAFRMATLQLSDCYFGSEKTLGQFRNNFLTSLKKEQSNSNRFNYKVKLARFDSAGFARKIEAEDALAADMELVHRVWEQSFSGMPLIFICSDADREAVREMVCRYFGALPQRPAISSTAPVRPAYRGYNKIEDTYPKTSEPKSEICYRFCGNTRLSGKEIISFDILDYVMSTRYLNLIREERGGTYHVAFDTELFTYGKYFKCTVEFQTRPEMRELLVNDVEEELERAATLGVTQEEFDDAVRYLRKNRAEKQVMKDNSAHYKNTQREYMVRWGLDTAYDFDKLIRRIKPSDISTLAAKVLKSDKLLTIYNEE